MKVKGRSNTFKAQIEFAYNPDEYNLNKALGINGWRAKQCARAGFLRARLLLSVFGFRLGPRAADRWS
jgi:hypothetical protein